MPCVHVRVKVWDEVLLNLNFISTNMHQMFLHQGRGERGGDLFLLGVAVAFLLLLDGDGD